MGVERKVLKELVSFFEEVDLKPHRPASYFFEYGLLIPSELR